MNKRICCIYALLLILLLLISCTAAYGAEIVDNAHHYVIESFGEQYTVREWGSADTETPTSHAFLITNEEAYNALFDSFPEGMTMDFSTEMLAVYTYSAIDSHEIRLDGIRVKDGVLHIDLREVHPFRLVSVGDATAPYQRVIAIKMDQLEVTGVTVDLDD